MPTGARQMRESFHVAYCFDKAYRQHFGAAVTSLLSNSKEVGVELIIHVVTDSLDPQLAMQLDEISNFYGVEIKKYPLSHDISEQINSLPPSPLLGYLSRAAYYRLWLADLLPAEVGKVLYLDSDTIVQKNLSELFAMPFDGSSILGVQDANHISWERMHGLKQYINSGVLLLNLDAWREKKLLDRCLQWVKEHPGRNFLADQCVINAALTDEIKLIPSQWNHYVEPAKPVDENHTNYIIHYITKDKPWQAWYDPAQAKPYWYYLSNSPWRGAKAEQATTVEQLYRQADFSRKDGRLEEALELFDKIINLQAKALSKKT